MRQSFDMGMDIYNKITYLLGTADTIRKMPNAAAKVPFDGEVLDFLNAVSKELLRNSAAKAYSDVVTLGFWLRRASLKQLEERFGFRDGNLHLGRGVAFHIAPSNVPVNFAYSLAVGMLTGNCNIVRIPSKDFPQTDLIVQAIVEAIKQHKNIEPYIALIRYGRERDINDALSAITDTRIIWGGDATIAELRKSPLPPRAGEVTFADRFSLAVIDSDAYMEMKEKKRVASDFYNDTYLTDQNACTSPRLVVWTGKQKTAAKERFWGELHERAAKQYQFQSMMSVDKLTNAYLLSVRENGARMEPHTDYMLIRVSVPKLTTELIEMRGRCGYFFEFDCDDLMELAELCNDKRIQTIGVIGDKGMLKPLLLSGIKGIDRIVEIGKTMDFDLLWDGYNLLERMTRTVVW